ncbi:Zinc finger protein a20 domain-containing, partial [Globisporangium splendens]
MAPNTSSSVFNDSAAASETKAVEAASVNVLSPSSAVPTTAEAAAVASASPSAPVPAASSSHDASEKSETPEDDDVCAEQHAVSASMSRFARVVPHGLDSVTPHLTQGFRKSCLKRSSSALPADIASLKQESIQLEAAEKKVPAIPTAPVQKNRRRCWECKVKVGLTAVKCRCDYTFCNKHRYAEEHKCSFDFKVSAKRKLEEENPRVVPLKVARIN